MSIETPAEIKITVNGTNVQFVAQLDAMTIDLTHTLSSELTEASAEYLAGYIPRLIANDLARRLAEPVRRAVMIAVKSREDA